MASRYDQKLTEKYRNILAVILSREDNKFCADCLAKGPRWASWNLGVLVCIRCSGLHRSMGVHISRVKSVNLDSWTKEQMITFCSRGNGWAKEMYEAKLPREYRRPQTDSSLEYFIRDKYEKKKYISPVEIPLRPLTGLGILEDDEPKKKRNERTKQGVSVVSIPKPSQSLRPVSPVIPRPKSLPQLPKAESVSVREPAQKPNSGPTTDDLLGLSSPFTEQAPASVTVTAPARPSADLSEDLFGPLSSFQSHSISSSVSSPDLLNGGTETAGTTNNEPASENAKDTKLSKDSILSLYSQGTKPSPLNTGNFMSQANMGYQQPQQHANQQQAFHGMNANTYQQQQQQQQQAMAMQQQQYQVHQMSQQMASMNMGGYPGMMQQHHQPGQVPMQSHPGYSMNYGVQPQMAQMGGQGMYGQNNHTVQGQGMYGHGQANHSAQAMYGGMGANPVQNGNTQMPAYSAAGMMQGNPGMNQNMWGAGTTPQNMMSGHTLSNQLWK